MSLLVLVGRMCIHAGSGTGAGSPYPACRRVFLSASEIQPVDSFAAFSAASLPGMARCPGTQWICTEYRACLCSRWKKHTGARAPGPFRCHWGIDALLSRYLRAPRHVLPGHGYSMYCDGTFRLLPMVPSSSANASICNFLTHAHAAAASALNKHLDR